jgi:hypothetical protein
MEPKAKDCAGLPGDLISFQAKDSTGSLQRYDGAKILRTLYETRDPVTSQSIFTDHEEIMLKRDSNPYWGLYKGIPEPPEPSASPRNSVMFQSSRRLLPANVSSVPNFFGTTVTNPLSSVPPKGGKTRRKRSKRKKTYRR